MADQPSSQSERDLTVREIAAALDTLVDHGFATAWRRSGPPRRPRWVVVHAFDDGPYTQRQISGWIAGCRAMGAAI